MVCPVTVANMITGGLAMEAPATLSRRNTKYNDFNQLYL